MLYPDVKGLRAMECTAFFWTRCSLRIPNTDVFVTGSNAKFISGDIILMIRVYDFLLNPNSLEL